MKNFSVKITFNTHCNENDIVGMKKKILECIKLKFWNVKNMELHYEETKKKEK